MPGMSPLQLKARMRTKDAAKIGMYRAAREPPMPMPQLLSDS